MKVIDIVKSRPVSSKQRAQGRKTAGPKPPLAPLTRSWLGDDTLCRLLARSIGRSRSIGSSGQMP
jgi:hypothetical protein